MVRADPTAARIYLVRRDAGRLGDPVGSNQRRRVYRTHCFRAAAHRSWRCTCLFSIEWDDARTLDRRARPIPVPATASGVDARRWAAHGCQRGAALPGADYATPRTADYSVSTEGERTCRRTSRRQHFQANCHYYLITIPYDPIPPDDRARRNIVLTRERYERGRDELSHRCDQVVRALARVGLTCRRLSDEEIAVVMHRVYHPNIPDYRVPPIMRLKSYIHSDFATDRSS